MTNDPPKVSIVILNYNGKHWLEKFLPGVIEHSTYPGCEVIVADNASTDDSVAFLKDQFPSVKIVINDKNTGYAGGYNEALQKIESDYYVLLNSDVEVTPQWMEHVMQFMLANENMVACQPKLLSYHDRKHFEYAGAAGGFIDKYGYPFCRGRLFETCEEDTGQYNQSGEVFWASGACLFVKADIFHKSGRLDADFFAHMEEIDLCWRLKNLGYKIGYCAESVVYHVGGGTLKKSHPKKVYLNFRNNRAMLHKNLPATELSKIEWMRNVLDKIAWLKARLADPREDADAVKRALADYHAEQGALDEKRARIEALKPSLAIGTPNKIGIFNGSLVWNYFIKGVKKFSGLNIHS